MWHFIKVATSFSNMNDYTASAKQSEWQSTTQRKTKTINLESSLI